MEQRLLHKLQPLILTLFLELQCSRLHSGFPLYGCFFELLKLTLDLPVIGEKTVVSNMLEWSLQVCLINYMFDEKFQIRPQFLSDVDGTCVVVRL